MALTVHTARLGYRGEDRLDITRKTADPVGVIFAPSWEILRPALDGLRVANILRGAAAEARKAGDERAETADACVEMERAAAIVDDATWALYRAAYTGEMRESYRHHRAAWDALLARGTVTLMCFCVNPRRCHRTILGAEILPRFGAQFGGERVAAAGSRG